jgi:FKBP-type peptidyl-prolyl cis-trans isomerase
VFDEGSFTEFYSLSNMIGGWILTLPLVKEGGKIRLYIPSSLAYGDEPPPGSGIPDDSMLIFDVTVDAVY